MKKIPLNIHAKGLKLYISTQRLVMVFSKNGKYSPL